MDEVCAVVMAAGDSHEMHSSTSRLVHDIGGKPIIRWVSDALCEAGALLKTLGFDQEKLSEAISGLHSLVGLPDLIGRTQLATLVLMPGSNSIGSAVRFARICVIFESRPDALFRFPVWRSRAVMRFCLCGGSAK